VRLKSSDRWLVTGEYCCFASTIAALSNEALEAVEGLLLGREEPSSKAVVML
jgi:hypothetical protein